MILTKMNLQKTSFGPILVPPYTHTHTHIHTYIHTESVQCCTGTRLKLLINENDINQSPIKLSSEIPIKF